MRDTQMENSIGLRMRSMPRKGTGWFIVVSQGSYSDSCVRVSKLSVWRAACISHLLSVQRASAQVYDLPAHRPKVARRRAFVVGIGHPRRELSPRDTPRVSSTRRDATRRDTLSLIRVHDPLPLHPVGFVQKGNSLANRQFRSCVWNLEIRHPFVPRENKLSILSNDL